MVYLSRFRMAWFSVYIIHGYFLDHRTIGIFSSTRAISNNAGKILILLPTFNNVNMRKYLGKKDNYIFQIAYVHPDL